MLLIHRAEPRQKQALGSGLCLQCRDVDMTHHLLQLCSIGNPGGPRAPGGTRISCGVALATEFKEVVIGLQQ